ncbi:hypothetical protein B1813_22820 [Saccharomonospora piscinae]|uniref:Uncharacterized protein n=1 Tax=Saccharomonospora piscinae TaxID=687388 RepID=A0A1V8ZW01_SACPI|nr:hypothetical protein [Saccharomonospora piscinae]OQO88988.1 hypothetical protein B1813_22820 [Saccharomonospora piscinae]
MSKRRPSNEYALRDRAQQALTRGRRDAPAVDGKLRSWGECDDQEQLWSRSDLSTDTHRGQR